MIQKLTKEEFWDTIKEKYPKAFEHFHEWLTKYKEEVYYPVFDVNYSYNKNFNLVIGKNCPKYHELPVAMQFGIFTEYTFHFANTKRIKVMMLVPRPNLDIKKEFMHLVEGHFEHFEIEL